MPYTPPSHRSPAASTPTSPEASRRPSLQSSSRPSLPRSASYLTRHRRTPSATAVANNGNVGLNPVTPPGTSEDLKSMATNASVRQSPPPVTDRRGIPNGAVISPPESASSGSDDEGVEMRGRKLENLSELKQAISQIPLHRESSPNKAAPESLPARSLRKDGMHLSFSTGALNQLAARTVSHARPGADSGGMTTKSPGDSSTASDDESDGEMRTKPQMVRKKSGELVRPALRPPSRRRPSSMPGTPTFSKVVHFDNNLEHVRHFLQIDRPLAVSAGSSPIDNYESETEYPFADGVKSPPYEWEIITNNFPAESSPLRRSLPARLERLWLSEDQKSLHGAVDVANLAFQKFVTCRFTLDYWKTTSEIAAEYAHEIHPSGTTIGHDRFIFTIKLSDLAHLESKTMYCCIRYNVSAQEYWDNNGGLNFQVDFRKKHLPQNGKKGFQGAASRPANPLPRSTRRPNPNLSPRPKSMPTGFDDFGDGKYNFDQPIYEYLGESGPTALRLKNRSCPSLASDNLSSRLSTPSGQAFANRYDFGASLKAAKGSGKERGEGLYMRHHRDINTSPTGSPPMLQATRSDPTSTGTDKAGAGSPVHGTSSPSTSLASSSYEDIISKYCFFGSKQSSPQIKEGTLKGGRFDGGEDGFGAMSSGNHTGPAQHHSLHTRDHNPYFQHAPAGSESPLAVSPMKHYVSSPDRSASPAHRANQTHAPSTMRAASPTSMVGSYPLAGTPPSELPYHAQHMQDRYPFVNTETHAATAIRG